MSTPLNTDHLVRTLMGQVQKQTISKATHYLPSVRTEAGRNLLHKGGCHVSKSFIGFTRYLFTVSHGHYTDVIMGAIASQITSLMIVYSTVYSDADQRKHHSSASLAFVWGIHRGPVNSPHKWPVTRKMFPFDDVIMYSDYFHD